MGRAGRDPAGARPTLVTSLVPDWFTAAILALVGTVWLGLTVLRFIGMDGASRLQSWRRYDALGLVPVGAFFSPGAPSIELSLVFRSRSSVGITSPWTPFPGSTARRWWHVFWNPGKIDYRMTVDLCRGLLSAGRQLGVNAEVDARLQLTDEYLALLRCMSCAARRSQPKAVTVQFAVLARDLDTGAVTTEMLSARHRIPDRRRQ